MQSVSQSIFTHTNPKLHKGNCVILGFRRDVDENYSLLCHRAASSGNYLPTFRDNLSLNPEEGADRLLRNVCKEWPLLAA